GLPFQALMPGDDGRPTTDDRPPANGKDTRAPDPGAAVRSSVVGRPSSVVGGRSSFLAERYEIDYAYSATAAHAARLARLKVQRSPIAGSLLAFANPDFGPELTKAGAPAAGDRPIIAASRAITAGARDVFLRGEGGIASLPGTQIEADALK